MTPLKQFAIGYSIVLCIGLVFFSFSIYRVTSNINFIRKSIITTGYISHFNSEYSKDNSLTYYTVVNFTDNKGASRYVTSRSSSSLRMGRKGDKVKVRYILNNSNKAHITDFFFDMWGVSIIFGLIGFIITSAGIYLMLSLFYPIYIKFNSKKYSRIVRAKVKEVYLDDSISLNNKNPYVIEASWKDPITKKIFFFYSDDLWENPTDKIGETIMIRIHPNNFDKYCMDISFLEEKKN